MQQDHDDLLDRAFAAVERNDAAAIAAIYADDVRIWHSHDGLVTQKTDNIAALGALHGLGTLCYRVLERVHAGSRVAQRHELTITTHDGLTTYRIDAALFATIEHGRITAFDEYMDSGQLRIVGAAMAAAGAGT